MSNHGQLSTQRECVCGLPNYMHRRKYYKYWPISMGWFRCGGHRIVCWHSWPNAGSPQHPDATAKILGWTLHLGPLKLYFGRRYVGGAK